MHTDIGHPILKNHTAISSIFVGDIMSVCLFYTIYTACLLYTLSCWIWANVVEYTGM